MAINLMYNDYLQSPIGTLNILASDRGIRGVLFIDAPSESIQENVHTEQAKVQLEQYFNRQRREFDLSLDQQGTPFQLSVWQCLQNIDYGQVRCYQDIALSIARPKAMRAVGHANGKNPISIIVPCHRVIGKNKTLTGYAYGLERKAWLLQHEGALGKSLGC